ncbi:MAG TPA: hypothetical protein VFK05_24570 [Polyangiaceae bacterium]|nr:hypothetical protein [Polyangiaceae bacterium]
MFAWLMAEQEAWTNTSALIVSTKELFSRFVRGWSFRRLNQAACHGHGALGESLAAANGGVIIARVRR